MCVCVEVLLRAQLRFWAALYSKQTTHLCSPTQHAKWTLDKERILFEEHAALQSDSISRRNGLKSSILD